MRTLLDELHDINACASDALDHLAAGRLADVRTELQGIRDIVREQLQRLDPEFRS